MKEWHCRSCGRAAEWSELILQDHGRRLGECVDCAPAARAAKNATVQAAITLGRLGGLARAKSLSPARRSAIAKQGSNAARAMRWATICTECGVTAPRHSDGYPLRGQTDMHGRYVCGDCSNAARAKKESR